MGVPQAEYRGALLAGKGVPISFRGACHQKGCQQVADLQVIEMAAIRAATGVTLKWLPVGH